MSMSTPVHATAVAVLMTTLVLAQTQTFAQTGEWRYHGGDAGHTRYSDLDQLTAENFEDLEVALV